MDAGFGNSSIENSRSTGHLFSNILLFARMLRAMDVDVTPTRVIDLAEALEHIDIGRRADFKNAARTVLVSRRQHLRIFDWIFDLFWDQAFGPTSPRFQAGQLLQKVQQVQSRMVLPEAENRDKEQRKLQTVQTGAFSARDQLLEKDFADLTEEELLEVKRLMRSLTWKLELRRTRRRVSARRGDFLDLRGTMRQSFKYGGEPVLLQWRRPKKKRRPLVLICDISGSMEPYSRLLLEFTYIMSRGVGEVESFAFGTRLTRLTHYLQDRDVNRALKKASNAAQDWGGGTRIGQALKKFNFEWGRRVLGRGAIVLIISDGWDRGDIEQLGQEMGRLQRNCWRLIWLNPLLGSPRYEPLTQGIQAALPHIDHFLPVHNLHSLEQLGALLQDLTIARLRFPERHR